MNCTNTRELWELYYDSEGDSELYLRVNEHLAECPACAKWFYEQTRFEGALAAQLAAPEPTPELWRRVLTETGVVEPVSSRDWSFIAPFLVLAASVLLAVGIWLFRSPAEPQHLSSLTAAVHQQLSEGAERVEFASLSDHEVEDYLKKRVTFPVRCPPRKDAGFLVRGGGVCQIAGDTAAYVVGRVEDRDVSIFILPEARLAEFAHEREVLTDEGVHHCREGNYDMVLAKIDRNVVVVIGHGRPEQLEKVVRAYGTYPEDPAANGARSAPKSPHPIAA